MLYSFFSELLFQRKNPCFRLVLYPKICLNDLQSVCRTGIIPAQDSRSIVMQFEAFWPRFICLCVLTLNFF